MTTENTTTPAGTRLNLKFILVVLIGLCVIGAGLVILESRMRVRRDQQTIEWAEEAMKQGRYQDAASQFALAVARRPQDADLSVKSGDALYALSASKPESLRQALVAWDAAARIRPDLGTLERMLRLWIDSVEVRPSATSFRQLDQIAQQVLRVSPSDKEAATARQIAMLGPWFAQAGPGNQAECTAHDSLIDTLGSGLRENPVDQRAILYFGLASARRAVELQQGGDDASAHQRLDRAEREISAVANGDASVQYRAAEGLTILAEASQRLEQMAWVQAATRPASGTATTEPAPAQRATTEPTLAAAKLLWPTWNFLNYQVNWDASESSPLAAPSALVPTTRPVGTLVEMRLAKARAVAASAAGMMHPSDSHFIDARLLEAHLAEKAGDRGAAEQICRQTLAARPGNLRAELALVGLISSSAPTQAMALLEQPEREGDDGPGAIALVHRELLAEASMQKARLYLDAAASSDDPSVRQANVQKANTACDVLAARLITDPTALKLTGRLRMFQGRYLDAIHLLDRAMASSHGKADADLLSYRATSLLALHELPAALDTLRLALQADPTRSAQRLLLAQTLIEDGRISEAARQVDSLEKQLPTDPRVLELALRWAVARSAVDPNDASARGLQEAYSKLPESSVEQKLNKADLALASGQAADAIRLLDDVRRVEPSSVLLAVESVRALIASNKLDQAKALLADAIGQHPGDASVLAVKKSLEAPVSLDTLEAQVTGADAKTFLTALHACRAALDGHELPHAKDQIDAMTRVRADDPLLFEVKFKYDLAAQQWSDAALCKEKLGRANLDGVEGSSFAFQLDVARGAPLAALCGAKQMTLRYPSFEVGWLDLGRALRAVGRDELAVDSFQHAVTLQKDDINAVKALAACLLQTGQKREADQWIANGRKIDPADAELREMEFVRQLAEGDPQRLIAPREAAIRSEPQRSDNVVQLARIYVRINCIENLSNPKGARDGLAKAIELLNGAVKRWPDDTSCSFWAAHAAALGGDVAGGKQILRRTCDRLDGSRRRDAEQSLAEFCLIWGDPGSAGVALGEARARGAAGSATARRLAAVLMRLGSWPEAMQALRDYPSDPLAQQERIMIFVAAGQGAQAEKDLQTAYADDPNSARLMTLFGILYFAERDDARARPWLDRAVAAGDEELAGRTRGALRLRAKTPDVAGALEDLAVAQEANPSDPGAALLLSEACLRNHDSAGATRVLKTALAATPALKDVRLSLLALEESSPAPAWDQIAALIEAGRCLTPSDWGWDAAESQMWSSRHQIGKAAALIRHAVQLARSAPEVADAALERQDAGKVRSLIPAELWMLLEAQAYDAVLADADTVISRYGPGDMLSAWAHHAKAAVQRRTGSGDGGAAEYNSAFETAKAAGGFTAVSGLVETISADAGPDEAIARIDAYVATLNGSRRETNPAALGHDARWDLLRVDLMRRNNETSAAAAVIDKLMPHLASLSSPVQVQFLRMAVSIYLEVGSTSALDKARKACLALLERLPDDTWALNNMAAICMERTKPSQADEALQYSLKAYQSAERVGEVDPRIADTYGWALANAGRGSEAIEILKPAAQRLAIPELEYHLARAYLAAGMPQPAGAHLVSALELVHRDEKLGHSIDARLRTGIANACWKVIGETTSKGFASWIKQSSGGSSGVSQSDQ